MQILGNYADFLADVIKDVDRATTMYKKALAADSQHVVNLHNYAAFLLKARHDHSAAEKLLKKALSVKRNNPSDADCLSLYGLLIQNYKDESRWDEAEGMHRKACQSSGVRATHLYRYADFLENVKGDKSKAAMLRKKAAKLRGKN